MSDVILIRKEELEGEVRNLCIKIINGEYISSLKNKENADVILASEMRELPTINLTAIIEGLRTCHQEANISIYDCGYISALDAVLKLLEGKQ